MTRQPEADFNVGREDWMDRGVCYTERVDSDVFIMDHGHTAAEAKTYCDRCTVKHECLNYARRTRSVGVWGGKLFTYRDGEEPDPIILYLDDARPQKLVPISGNRQPGILGLPTASGFSRPGILG